MKAAFGDLIVSDVVDLKPAGVHVAQQHVGFAEAAEVAEALDLPIQADGAQQSSACVVVVGDAVDLERPAYAVAQHHVGGVVPGKPGERDERPIGSNRRQPVRG